MIYLLDKEEFDKIQDVIKFDDYTVRDYGVAIRKAYFERLVASNRTMMTSICLNVLGTEIDAWLESKKHYPYKLYNFVANDKVDDVYRPPTDIDFITGLNCILEKKVLPKIDGVPTASEYYESFDGTTYSNLILKVVFNFKYDELGFCTNPDKEIVWINENNEESSFTKELKTTLSMATNFNKILREGILRRQNIVDDIQFPMLAMLAHIYDGEKTQKETLFIGRDLLSDLSTSLDAFVERALEISDSSSEDYGRKEAFVAMRDYSGEHNEWLDVNVPSFGMTPRQFVMGALDT